MSKEEYIDTIDALTRAGLTQDPLRTLPPVQFDGGGGVMDDAAYAQMANDATASWEAAQKKEIEDFLASPAANVYKQILAQGTTGNWSGEGFGGPEANAREMSRMLSKAGITDIRDFGQIKKTIYNQTPVQAELEYTDYGTFPTGRYYQQDPESGQRSYVDASKVKTEERSEGSYGPDQAPSTFAYHYVETPAETTVFGNKKTGQEIDPNYNRAGGNVFGGTYTGDGRTNFNVEFAPDGTPYFYTQFGGSTSDFAKYAPIIGIGLSLFAPGIGSAIGSALTGTATTTLASQIVGSAILQGTMAELSGGDFVDGAVRGAVTAGAAPIVSQTIGASVANAMGDSVFRNLVTNTVTSAATNAVVAGFTGQDVSDAALSGAISGAVGTVGQELGTSAEYDTSPFTKQNQMLIAQERGMGTSGDLGRIAARTGTSILMGADPTQSIISGLINASQADELSRPDAPEEKVSSNQSDLNSDNLNVAGADALDNILAANNNQDSLPVGADESSLESIFSYPSTQTAGLSDESNRADLEIIDSLTKNEPPAIGTNVITAPDGSQLVFDQDNNLVDIIEAEGGPSELMDSGEFQGPMGPLTEDKTKRFNDEFARYLDYLQDNEPPPPGYGIQDLGITQENFDSFNQNLLNMQNENRLPTQWAPNEDGTLTFTSDDGSTITINDAGEITHYTDAPQGNLLTDIVTPPATPTTPATGGTSSGTSSTNTSTKPGSGLNFGSVISLLGAFGGAGGMGGAGGGRSSVTKPAYATDIPEFDVTKMFSPTLYAQQQKYAKKQPLDENQEKQTAQYP